MCIFLLVTIQSKIFHLRRIRQVVHNSIQQWLRNRKYSNQYVDLSLATLTSSLYALLPVSRVRYNVGQLDLFITI